MDLLLIILAGVWAFLIISNQTTIIRNQNKQIELLEELVKKNNQES